MNTTIEKIKLSGQAVIEGVMIRTADVFSISVRRKDGTITSKTEIVKPYSKRFSLFKLPVFRGFISLVEALYYGIKGLNYSADLMMIDEGEEKTDNNMLYSILSVGFGLLLGVLLFFYLPLFLSEYITVKIGTQSNILFNLIDGIFRILIFLIYVISITFLKDIRRFFEYHGAEHKGIHSFEKDSSLEIENVKKYTTLHPRCGTSFLFYVLFVSILLFMFIPKASPVYVKFGVRVLLIPLIAGLSYEVLKIGEKTKSKLTNLAVIPGLLLQKITTKEPDDKQLEVSIDAIMNAVKIQEKMNKEQVNA